MRRIMLLTGVAVLAGLWFGPLPLLAERAFYAHMTLHMGVVAVAAPLLALGIAGGPFDPVRKAPGVINPITTSLLELLIVWIWHTPALHHMARNSLNGLVLEQGLFLVAGLLVWVSAFGGNELDRGNRAAVGVVGLLLTSMHMTLLGALLALTPRALYVHAGGISWLTPLEDQHLGGAIMILVGGASYLTGGLWLTVRLVRDRVLKQEEKA